MFEFLKLDITCYNPVIISTVNLSNYIFHIKY